MVRLKQRYILFDILYPPETNSEDFTGLSATPESALLTLCKSSPSTINPKSLTQMIRKALQDHYGDFGAGAAGMSVSIKYFNNKTSTGIIRCSRLSFQLVMASLTLMNRIGGSEVIVRCLHVSGTIKKCEEFSIKRNKDIMLMIKRGNNTRNLSKLINYQDMDNMNVEDSGEED